MKTALARAFRIGWESAKADFRPLLVLWGFACLLTAGYFGVEPLRAAAGRLGDVMRTAGWRGAFASQLFFHGVVPWAFFRLFRTIRPPRPALVSAAIALWSATLGIVCFGLFHLQDALFGTGTDVLTLVKKMAFDQFVFVVFLAAPLNATFYFWVGRNFSVRRIRADWPRNWLGEILQPNLLANWVIAIPTVTLTYAFPVELRVVFMGLVGAFWCLVCVQIGARSSAPAPTSASRACRPRSAAGTGSSGSSGSRSRT